jgi:hypothetical protein
MRLTTTIGAALAALCLSAAGLAPAAASAAGSLSVTPGILERVARPGPLGTVTVSNTTGRAIRVGVAVRPWRQSRRSGSVAPDRRRTLGLVRPGKSSFGLPPGGSRSIPLRLVRGPKRGSLYGAIEVTGAPRSRRKGPRVGYRLVSSLRLFPPAGARRLEARPARLFAHRRGPLFLAVKNFGNTIDPIRAKVTIRGRGRTLRIRTLPKTILPGRTVDLRLRRGLPRGRYKVAVRLTQAGRRVGGMRRVVRLR